jgi:hypothetical protein
LETRERAKLLFGNERREAGFEKWLAKQGGGLAAT